MVKSKLFIFVIFLFTSLFLNFSSVKENKILVSGTNVAELESVDVAVSAFMSKWKIPGGSVALMKDGRLVYSKAFGVAYSNVPVECNSLFRIASLSKPITSLAIMKMVEQGKIFLSQKVFGENGILNDLKYSDIFDERIKNITIQNLLQHTGGWDRDISPCGDPMFDPIHIAESMDSTSPAKQETIIKYMLGKQLDFSPGTRYAYSNFGYCILGRVIEKISQRPYEDFVKENILTPAGIFNMQLGKTTLCDRCPNEVKYFDYSKEKTSSVCDAGKMVPQQYGGFYLEAMDSHGGWLASSVDLARLLISIDTKNNSNCILQNNSIDQMLEPCLMNNNYCNGWFRNSLGNYWHTGALIGTSTMMAQTYSGISWVILFNANPGTNTYYGDLDQLMWNALKDVQTWPTNDLLNGNS